MLSILTALGSYGDVHPMVGLGVALRSRGHDVRVISNPYFREVIEGAGLAFESVSTAEEYERLTKLPGLWRPSKGLDLVFQHGALGVLDELYSIIERLYCPAETVIAAHGLDLASRLAAEKLGAPVSSVVYAPIALPSNSSPPRFPVGLPHRVTPAWLARLQVSAAERLLLKPRVVRPLNRRRRDLGMEPIAGSFFDWYYRVARPVSLFPDWFAADPGDWPNSTVTTCFPLWDGSDQQRLSDELESFLSEGDPPIVFTPGSANRQAEYFFQAAAEACQRLGRRGVLLTKYSEQVPAGLPPSVRWFGFTPLGNLLPRAAAFVHHGGIGSCARGLAAGTPQVIQPFGFDQFDNSMRLRRLGVAAELPRNRFRGAALASVLDRLLSSSEVSEACRRSRERIAQSEGLAMACSVLEERLTQAS